ncbi:MAG TPA: pyridoxine 5'-phosphate synthase [Spirochaetota bacterium]|nr:pyridoxine 5'-phosphate synthase [Spirochaetota bacterium]
MGEIQLCVNIDHIATVRQARGGREPDPLHGAVLCEQNGADGITVHLREDRRHIQDRDVRLLKEIVRGKYNLEMALSEEIIRIALEVVPHQVTLVPEKRQELTTEGGLNVEANFDAIARAVERFRGKGILVSLFIEPDPETVELSKKSGAEFIEIHTGSYCNAAADARDRELDRILAAARLAADAGLRVNAGHGLTTVNVVPVLAAAGLEELNIGHSIISRAVFLGLGGAVREMKDVILRASAGVRT